ncbi:MAG: chemotaxis protein CheB [Balneolaceae bacterium]
METIRVYVIDSSVLVRQTMANIIQNTDGTDISDSVTADSPSGQIIGKIHRQKPDVVLLGLDRPESSTGQLFVTIRNTFPELPVIILTPRTVEGGKAALFALKKGAIEYITKPAKSSNLLLAYRHLEKRLRPALQLVPDVNRKVLSSDGYSRLPQQKKAVDPTVQRIDRPVELVVIGGCSGGVKALYPIVERLPADLPVPVVIVQHMPRIYTRALAEELDEITSLNVREATYDSLLLPGQVYLAPGGYHASIKNNAARKQITLHRGPKEHRCRPSVDVLLRSVTQVYKNRVLTVFLSGSGRDGLLGARKISASGGQVILQSKETSLIWDLPAEIDKRSINEGEYDITDLANEIAGRVKGLDERVRVAPSIPLSRTSKGHGDYGYMRV